MPSATIRQRDIFYTVTSPSEGVKSQGQTIVFVHGLGSTSSFFHPIIPHLTSEGHKCITFDNYGAGRSPLVSSDAETSIESIAEDVIALLDRLHVSRAVIVGYSMGGLVPLSLAATHSSRVVAGICLGPVNPENKAGVEALAKRIEIVSEQGMEAMALQVPATAPAEKASPLTRAFIRAMILAQQPNGYIANVKAIVNAKVPDYEKIKAPIFVVVGEEDKSCQPKYCQHIYMNLGNSSFAKFDVLEGVGHWYCVEEPEQVGKLVGDFIKSVT